jgi:hypothetical protein
LKQPDCWNLIQQSQVNQKNDVMEDWLDSGNGKQLKQYCKDLAPESIPVFIQICLDELETTNPFGSKTGIYKLRSILFCCKKIFPLQ